MTEEEATKTVRDAEPVAKAVYTLVRTMTSPDCAIVAIGLVAGTVFACLELEDDVTIDGAIEDWTAGVKEQYKHIKADMNKQQVQ